ncbi:MAG TPA: histidine phosphatase family protein [Nannocystaceae bacterium]|nr:histidine phosphatase family protein [Nannocystaceae bacterium]
MAQLVVVRHGQASLFAADYDVLSERGIEQAKRLGAHLRATGTRFAGAFTGPARRQRDTARWAGGDEAPWPELVVVPELDEHDAFTMVARVVPQLQSDPEIGPLAARLAEPAEAGARGATFQLLFEAVMRKWLRSELDAPELEAWPSFRERVRRGLGHALEGADKGDKRIVFTSVGPIAVMLQHALGLDDVRAFETAWRIRNASITTFVVRGREVTLDSFNALPHLPDPTAWTFR